MSAPVIAVDDPERADVRALLAGHLDFMRSQSPPENVFALGTDGLLDPAVTFYTCRRDDLLLAMGALRELSPSHGEIKSMHTAGAARGTGLGRMMLSHLLAAARQRGYCRVSLETGSMAGFAPARRLYTSAGFVASGPFGDYPDSPHSMFLTREL